MSHQIDLKLRISTPQELLLRAPSSTIKSVALEVEGKGAGIVGKRNFGKNNFRKHARAKRRAKNKLARKSRIRNRSVK